MCGYVAFHLSVADLPGAIIKEKGPLCLQYLSIARGKT